MTTEELRDAIETASDFAEYRERAGGIGRCHICGALQIGAFCRPCLAFHDRASLAFRVFLMALSVAAFAVIGLYLFGDK